MKDYELTAVDIASQAIPVSDLCGVYFLLDDTAKIVYVGQSRNVYDRVSAHLDGWKKFSSVAYVKCQPDRLNKLESHYINKFRPKYNGRYENGDMVAPITRFDMARQHEAEQECMSFLHNELTAVEWGYLIDMIERAGGSLRADDLRNWESPLAKVA